MQNGETLLEDYGLGTVESRSLASPATNGEADGLGYLDFWKGPYWHLLAQHLLLDAEGCSTLTAQDKVMRELTRVAVRGDVVDKNGIVDDATPRAVDLLRETGDPPSTYKLLFIWDRGLGGLNTLSDAQGDLLRAAGQLIASNLSGEFIYPTLVEGDKEGREVKGAFDVLAHFNSLWDSNDNAEAPLPARQRGVRATLLTAQFIHKAALLDDDPSRRGSLLAKAQTLYRQVSASTPPNRRSQHSYKARELNADIEFQGLLDEIDRATSLLNDPSKPTRRWARETRAAATESIQALMLQECEELIAQSWHSSAPSGEALQGNLFEKLTRLTAWDYILDRLAAKDMVPPISVRKAFDHEDRRAFMMHLARWPNFDVLLTRHSRNGTYTTSLRPVQLKAIHDKDNYVAEWGEVDSKYAPGIHLPPFDGVTIITITNVAERLIAKYRGGEQDITSKTTDYILRALGLQATR